MSNISALTTQAPKSTFSIPEKDMKKIDKTAEDFEAVFVTEMLRPMMNMIQVDPEFGGGKGEEVFRDFTLNEYGKRMASQGGFGIATHVKDQLIKLQAQAALPGATPQVLAEAIRDAKTGAAPVVAAEN